MRCARHRVHACVTRHDLPLYADSDEKGQVTLFGDYVPGELSPLRHCHAHALTANAAPGSDVIDHNGAAPSRSGMVLKEWCRAGDHQPLPTALGDQSGTTCWSRDRDVSDWGTEPPTAVAAGAAGPAGAVLGDGEFKMFGDDVLFPPPPPEDMHTTETTRELLQVRRLPSLLRTA